MNVFASGPVLVPWDFSDYCLVALQLAVETAGPDVPIEVIYVSDSPVNFIADVGWDSIKEDIIAKTASEKFKHETPADLVERVRFHTKFGNPGDEIVKYAGDIQAAVIVMSTQGRGGFSRMLMGSVADRVIRTAPCPVFMIRNQSAAA